MESMPINYFTFFDQCVAKSICIHRMGLDFIDNAFALNISVITRPIGSRRRTCALR